MEYITLGIFSLMLFACLIFDISILYALGAGLLLFITYGVIKGYKLKDILKFALSGIKTVRQILITFMLIGIMTALWRSSGTIPMIVCKGATLVSPYVFLLMTFALNCLISFLTGTAFGTAATMGVICSTIGTSLGVPAALTGGAVLSGVYFGDRCSPISTSALLVSTLTKTDLFSNIKNMLLSSSIPFLITCAIYAVVGFTTKTSGIVPDLSVVFEKGFDLSYLTVIPAVVLLMLAVFKVNVKIAMSASIIVSIPICIWVQNVPISSLPAVMFFGYHSVDTEIASMLNGGGIISMLKVASIVCISSAYAGIFRKTGMLDRIKSLIAKIASHSSPVIATLMTSVITGMIACNQTLTIMLTDQLCNDTEKNGSRFALTLENTAVVIAPLIPWSIAGAVPLTSVSAPSSSILFACFLYILPIWHAIIQMIKQKKIATDKRSLTL